MLPSGSIPHPRGICTPTPPGPGGAWATAPTPPGDGQNSPLPDSLSQVQAGVWAGGCSEGFVGAARACSEKHLEGSRLGCPDTWLGTYSSSPLNSLCLSSGSGSLVGIDNKIEQAMVREAIVVPGGSDSCPAVLIREYRLLAPQPAPQLGSLLSPPELPISLGPWPGPHLCPQALTLSLSGILAHRKPPSPPPPPPRPLPCFAASPVVLHHLGTGRGISHTQALEALGRDEVGVAWDP